MGRVGEAGEGLTLDDLRGLEAHAASAFFKLVRGLDSRGRWKDVELGEAREKLEKWMGARRTRKLQEDYIKGEISVQTVGEEWAGAGDMVFIGMKRKKLSVGRR